jgi:hypothetical protein
MDPKLEAHIKSLVNTILAHEYIADPTGVCQVCDRKRESITHFRRNEAGEFVIPIRDRD